MFIDLHLKLWLPSAIAQFAVQLALLYRRIRYGYRFRRIPLTRGQWAIVDPEDYEWLMQFKWHASDGRGGNFYAVNRKMQKMHRMIMLKANPNFEILNTKPVLRPETGTTEGRQILNSNDKNSKQSRRRQRAKLVVDHINRNGLDNRKVNLRVVTHTQNKWNNGQRVERYSSKYRGVSWHKRLQKWAAIISVGGRAKHLGYYSDEEEAARAFDRAAREHRGKYAVLNFPST